MKCPNCNETLINRPIDPEDSLHCPVRPFIMFPDEKKLESLYVGVSVVSEGREAITASLQFHIPMPIISSRKEIIEQVITEEPRDSCRRTGMEIIIAKFKRVEDN